jgi:predicted DNA-binding transcriptional regulator AlpA
MSTNLAPASATLSPVVTQTEILTVSDVAKLLKFSKGQVYDLTRSRAKVRQTRPIPVLRINGNLRFRRSDIEQWLNGLAEAGRVQ